MAKMEQDYAESKPVMSNDKLLAILASKALTEAIWARAELRALKQQIQKTSLALDEEEFRSARDKNFLDAIRTLLEQEPEWARWLPKVADDMDSSRFLDPP